MWYAYAPGGSGGRSPPGFVFFASLAGSRVSRMRLMAQTEHLPISKRTYDSRFLDIARGSVAEVQSLLYVACDVGYIDPDTLQQWSQVADDTAALVSGLAAYLRKRSPIPPPDSKTPDSKTLE